MINTGLMINGRRLPVPGLVVINYNDMPRLRLKMGQDGAARPRGVPVMGVVLHTTRGAPDSQDKRPQVVRPGFGHSSHAGVEVVEDWSKDSRCAGAHLIVDYDGIIYCLADLFLEETYHATSVNARTVGIEIKQGHDNELYAGQLDAVVTLVNWLTVYFGIQRQIPGPYHGHPIPRLAAGGRDFYGVYGHRDQTDRRGSGDPGDPVMDLLAARGYERFDLALGADLGTWKARQAKLGVTIDGIPGPKTVAALKLAGYLGGIYALGQSPEASAPPSTPAS